ncbi:hypothetical protein STEG23_014632 [Scotinomys teguina]
MGPLNSQSVFKVQNKLQKEEFSVVSSLLLKVQSIMAGKAGGSNVKQSHDIYSQEQQTLNTHIPVLSLFSFYYTVLDPSVENSITHNRGPDA